MWVEAEKNRTKWSCELQYRGRCFAFLHSSLYSNQFVLSTQISEEPPPYSIFRTVKGLPLSGFHIGRISRAFRNLQLLLPTSWAKMPTVRISFRTWGSCTRPIIRQRAHGRLSMTMCRLLDLVIEHSKCRSIRKSVLLTSRATLQEKPST